MSQKDGRPTLAGVNVKTRKRNIAIPLDPAAFAHEVLLIFQEVSKNKPQVTLDEYLQAVVIELSTTSLDFSRYGDTLFEIMFAGSRMSTGANLVSDTKEQLNTNVLACKSVREEIFPYIKAFQSLVRRRPSLIKNLESVMVKLLTSLDFFPEEQQIKIAKSLAMVFEPSMKIGVLPENVLSALLNDRLVQKGTVMSFLTIFFNEFLSVNKLDDLVAVLTKGKVANRLYDFFPPQKRNLAAFSSHFNAVGLKELVEWHKKKMIDIKINELRDNLREIIEESTEEEILSHVKDKAMEGELPDDEVIKVIWDTMMVTINMAGKNQQQLTQILNRVIQKHSNLINAFCQSARLEASLLVCIQVYCYEDNRLLKAFSDIVRILYNEEIVGEDTIMYWYTKGSHVKGRNVFLKDIEPFINWLKVAEEDDDEDEEEDEDEDD